MSLVYTAGYSMGSLVYCELQCVTARYVQCLSVCVQVCATG
jgi:hypothetical protein